MRIRLPKRMEFDLIVPGRPAEVADRLGAVTRRRLLPSQGSWLGGRRLLGGRVDASGFRLALDPFDPWTRLQAVAVGDLVDLGDGRTRVRGSSGLPTGLTWYLRFADVLIAVMGGVMLVGGVAGGPRELLAAGLMAVLFAVIGVFAIGFHVANADTQVDGLTQAITSRALGAGAAEAAAPLDREPDPVRPRRPERARER